MNKILSALIVALLAAVARLPAQEPAAQTHATADGLVLTPPMGWYPWNQFGEAPQNEQMIKEIADAVVSTGLRDAGYAFVGPDEGICFERGTNGLLTTVLSRYPSGLRGLGDYIHRRGLKYALYTDAGTRTCSKAMPGTKGHEFEDMRAFAAWRCDYLKIDWCNAEGMDIVKAYTLLHAAQLAAGRPIVHSLCTWGEGQPWKWAAPIGHLWRTTSDICAPGHANWGYVTKYAWQNEKLYASAGPGHWNDPDMMIVGMAGVSDARNRTFFSLWCHMAAPLMAGNDVRSMTPATVAVLTNLEAIAVNQDPLGIQGHVVREANDVSVWGGKRLYDGSQAVVVYNQGKTPAQVRLAWTEIGLDESAALYVRNLWTHETTGPFTEGLSLTIAADESVMLRLSKSDKFPIPPILSANTYLLSFQAVGATPQTLSGQLIVKTVGTDELPAWRVRKDLPAWLSVKVAKDGKRQTLVNTIATAGLKNGSYHAQVRADNREPVTGQPLSALYYDVDLDVPADIAAQ